MAFTATFIADTTKFDEALRDAARTVKVFGEGAEATSKGVQASFQRMVSLFDGSKILTEARKTAEAVERIGGASKLTEAEQRRVNATVTEALAKYKALGQEAPDAMKRLHAETTVANKALTDTATATKGVGEGTKTMTQRIAEYAAGVAVFELARRAISAVFDAFKAGFAATLALGDNLANLSAKTGMSVEGLQKLKFAGAGAGVPLEALADAAAMLGVRLENGDKGAVGALKRLGISLASFKTLDTDTQLLTINQALLTVGNTSERNALQADLFGKAWKTVAPAMASDLTAIGKRAEELGVILDKQTVAAIDDMGDKIDALTIAGEGMIARFMLPFIETAGRLSDKLGGMKVDFGTLAEALGRVVISGGNLWNPLQVATALMNTLAANSVRAKQAFADLGEEMKRNMRSTSDHARATGELTDAQKKAAAEAKKHADELAKVSGLDKVQAARELTRLITELGGTGKIAASRFADVNKTLTDGIVIGTELGIKLPSAMVQFARETQTANDKLVNMAEILKGLPTIVNKIPVPMASVPGFTTGLPGSVTGYPAQVSTPGLNGVPVPDPRVIIEASQQWRQFTEGISASFVDMMIGLRRWKDGLHDIWMGALTRLSSAIGSVFDEMIARIATQAMQKLGIGVATGTGAGAGGGAGAAGWAGVGAAGFAVGQRFGRGVGTLAGGFFGWLGGETAAGQRRRDNRAATEAIQTTQAGLIDQFGSRENIAGRNTAGQALVAAWGSQGVQGQQEFNALVAEFTRMTEQQNKLLKEQGDIQATIRDVEQERARLAESLVVTWDQASKVLEKYGISLDAAGKNVQQLATTANFKTILDDIETLIRAGVDVGGMLDGMADEISKVVNESLRLGTEIPENMKPYIEELIRSGKLLDANGKAFTDISSFQFGKPVQTEAEKVTSAMAQLDEVLKGLTDRLAEIVDALARMLPAAAQEGADGVDRAFRTTRPRITVDVDYNDPGAPGGPGRDGESSRGYATGSAGLKYFGAGTMARLHGWEAVVPEHDYNALQARARGGSGGTTIVVNVDASNSYYDSETSRQRHGEQIAAALSRQLASRAVIARAA